MSEPTESKIETSIEIGPKEEMESQVEDIESVLREIKKIIEQQDPSTYNTGEVQDMMDDVELKLQDVQKLMTRKD